ncbi:50S ribosomal protein L18 [Candidatus Woesearchaeota archaeon]|nr:50S ribosomal protein L18P [uncultured archaeon]MBS3100520.1 50S ribosomal protein L18 [Candidatus Woesearchaeota archaeon]
MISGKTYTMPFRRKRLGRTNYRKRLKLLVSNRLRFVVRKSLKNFHAAVVEYSPKGDKVLLAVSSNTLAKLGWNYCGGNLPSAYLTGFLAGKKALEKGIKDPILDIGFNNSSKGSGLYAVLAGAVDAGLKIPFEKEMLPQKERLSGEHIAKYAQALKNEAQRYKKQFSGYIKKGMNPEDITANFNSVKGKMHG